LQRFKRKGLLVKKHDHEFPINACKACLKIAGITIDDIDVVAFYDKPLLKFDRLLETYLAFAPKGIASFLKAIPLWLQQKLWIQDLIKKN